MTNRLTDLPDFNDMYETIDRIKELTLTKLVLEIKIKEMISEITQASTNDVRYFVNDKPPSMAYLDKTFTFSGLDGELIPLRKELATLIAELEHIRLVFDLDNSRINVWRTQSANERKIID